MIRRRPKKTEFTQVQNAMLLNPNLSLKAKGLLTIMMSRPEDWTFYMSWLEAQSTDGRDAHRSAMQELIGAGYVERKKINGETGKIEWEYIVDDIPFAAIDGFSGDGSTVYGKPAATNTDYTNTNSKDASASRVASQPQGFADESPEERESQESLTLPSGPNSGEHETVGNDGEQTPPPVARPPLPAADFAPSDFPTGTSAHPEAQTPLPDPPVVSTGHSLLAAVTQLRDAGKPEMDRAKQKKKQKDNEHRKHWAIRGSIENAAEQAIFDMAGEAGYTYVLRLIRDTRTSADTILGWFKRRPILPDLMSKLDGAAYDIHLQSGIEKAKGYRSGWEASPIPLFFESIVSQAAPEQRKVAPNGNSRHEYKVRMDSAQTAEEVRAIIEEFNQRGQLETRMKRDSNRVVMKDDEGKPMYNSPEEEVIAVCESRGLSLTKGDE